MNDREKLEAGAGSLSSYNGGNNYEDYEGEQYEGENFDALDGLISHPSASSESFDSYSGLSRAYAKEVQQGRVYIIKVTNLGRTVGGVTTYIPCSFYLHSGYKMMFAQTGQITEAIFNSTFSNTTDTIEGCKVKCESISQNGSTYNELLYFSLFNPMHVVGLKIKTSDSDNLEGAISIQPISPFRKLDNRAIYLSTHQNEQDYKDNVVTVKEGFDFNNQTQVSMTLTGGSAANLSAMTITLVFGQVLNTAVALARVRHSAEKRRSHGHPRKRKM